MKAYIGVTDRDWYTFLSQSPGLDELNFWQPGGNRTFGSLEVGEPFLFKLHAPENFIVGGGFFLHASLLPVSLAWDAFGEKNGATSLAEMRRRIEKYRRRKSDPHEDYRIGCLLLGNPFFLERHAWIPAPEDFHPNIVQGKTYDLRSATGRALWESVAPLIEVRAAANVYAAHPASPTYGEPVLVRPRLGQGAFRVVVTDTYQRRCAITGEKALPVIQAAHIKPVSEGGDHRIDNGLLLRSDVHTLFDRGYVTISPEYKFLVSHRLRDDFDNGEHYYRFKGKTIWLPPHLEDRPNKEFLEWHSDSCFFG